MTRITISIDDWVINTYLSRTNNRSSRIQKLIILGGDSELRKHDDNKQQQLNLIEQLDNLKTENRMLKIKNETLKNKLSPKKKATLTTKEIYESLSQEQITILERCSLNISRDPMFFEGNFKLFKQDTITDITKEQFKELITYSPLKLNSSPDAHTSVGSTVSIENKELSPPSNNTISSFNANNEPTTKKGDNK